VIFISYSRDDRELVFPVVDVLRASGNHVFVDADNLEYGENWTTCLEDAIQDCERFLLFWSKSSRDSDFVQKEWQWALENESCTIVPVMLDSTPLPKELKRIQGTTKLKPIFRILRCLRFAKKHAWKAGVLTILLVVFWYVAFEMRDWLAATVAWNSVRREYISPIIPFLVVSTVLVLIPCTALLLKYLLKSFHARAAKLILLITTN
jgi:hypothetical protein